MTETVRQKRLTETAAAMAAALDRQSHDETEPKPLLTRRVSLKLRVDYRLHDPLRELAHERRQSINAITTEILNSQIKDINSEIGTNSASNYSHREG